MQIQLSEQNVMWFLGEPKKLIVSLNYVEPGPVEIEFETLAEKHQEQLLIAVRDGLIVSDVSYQDLYQVWLKRRPTVQEVTPDPHEQFRLAMARQVADKVEKKKQAFADKQRKLEERCVYLASKSVAVLKTTIANEKDEKVLRCLLRIEEQEKQRTMVLRALHDKLRRLETQRAVEIEKATLQQIQANPQIKKTSPLSVIESEHTTVTLTPEDLIEAVTAPGGE